MYSISYNSKNGMFNLWFLGEKIFEHESIDKIYRKFFKHKEKRGFPEKENHLVIQ